MHLYSYFRRLKFEIFPGNMPTDPASLLTLTRSPFPLPPPPLPMENPLREPYLHTEFGIMAWKFHRSQGHFSSDVFVAALNPSCYLHGSL